jgi:hypothetical protein
VEADRLTDGGTAARENRSSGGHRGSVGHLVERWAASRVDVSGKTRLQYEWAGHVKAGIGMIRVDRLERADAARWLDVPLRRAEPMFGGVGAEGEGGDQDLWC